MFSIFLRVTPYVVLDEMAKKSKKLEISLQFKVYILYKYNNINKYNEYVQIKTIGFTFKSDDKFLHLTTTLTTVLVIVRRLMPFRLNYINDF